MFQSTNVTDANSHNGKILEAYLMPHPPIILPEIGKGEESKCRATIDAFENISERIKQLTPDTIIIITPHGPVFQDAISISTEKVLSGSFKDFTHSEISFEFENDYSLTNNIIKQMELSNILMVGIDKKVAKEYGISTDLDHGTLVPLYYIDKAFSNSKLVHITIGMLSYDELYNAGIAIKKAVRETSSNVIIIASGDLSHRLTKTAPAGFNEKGKIYDMNIVESIKSANIESILSLEQSLVETAGQCAHRPLIMMLGTLDGNNINSKVLSYEGPFGVGYSVASLLPDENISIKSLSDTIKGKMDDKINHIRKKEDAYVNLARVTLEHYVTTEKVLTPPRNIPKEMKTQKAGVFVSIKKDGQLRGCIGTTAPTKDDIAYEIINNSISAGTKDPRFPPVTENELKHLVYNVDVLKEPEPIESIEELDVIKYGVIVTAGYRRGLLLPNLEGIDTPEEQLSIALQKAGIRFDENYQMQRFEVIRHK